MTTLTAEEREHLVLMATCAPSVHNTQPWQFVPEPDGVLLRVDRSRQLTVLDPEGRELLVSCGTAVHHLQVAARALGLDTEVELFPDRHSRDTVARVRTHRGEPASDAEVASAVAILHRHTHRGRFTDEHVPDEVLERLRVAVEGEGGLLRVVRDDELVEVEVLVSRAEQALLQTPGYTGELSRWVWHEPPDEERGDGMPQAAVDHGPDRAESLQGRQFEGTPAPRPLEPPTPEHPAVVVLSTEADTPTDWVQAGRALSALLLTATELGALAQPIGQVIDVPKERMALQRLLGTVGPPQMVLRLGMGVSAPVSPRRPVDEVLRP
ncbi:MAG: nitroreductase family protein [Mycobacteriales bacterium]